MEFDHEAGVEVRFAEDLTYVEVAPLLDALAATPIFTVRATRVGWSGPAAGGPEVAVFLAAAAAAGAGVFLASFCAELGKDAYRGVRAAVGAVMKKLREREPEERRAVVPLVIVVGEVRICVGRMFHQDPAPDEWSDEWFLERLRRAQEIVDRAGSLTVKRSIPPGHTPDEFDPCEFWLD
jgi:hypothetical protein